MTEADFLATGYYGLQTGILGVTALFTLVFAYIGGLHLFLRKEPLITRLAVYILFLFAFAFLMMFLYSASLSAKNGRTSDAPAALAMACKVIPVRACS